MWNVLLYNIRHAICLFSFQLEKRKKISYNTQRKNFMPCRQIQCNNFFASTITIHAMSAIYRNIRACAIVFHVFVCSFVCVFFVWIESETNRILFSKHESLYSGRAWAKVIKFWCAHYLLSAQKQAYNAVVFFSNRLKSASKPPADKMKPLAFAFTWHFSTLGKCEQL